MSKARLVITAVVVEGRSPAEVARTYGVSRSWIYELVARYRTEGDSAYEPRSRRALRSPRSTIYNEQRPHRSLAHRSTPAVAYQTRPKATPGQLDPNPHHRVRHDRVDDAGKVTLRHNGKLHHIGIGRPHARTRVILLIQDLDIRIINAATGEILRTLSLDPTRTYHGTGKPIGGPRRPYGPRKTKRSEP